MIAGARQSRTMIHDTQPPRVPWQQASLHLPAADTVSSCQHCLFSSPALGGHGRWGCGERGTSTNTLGMYIKHNLGAKDGLGCSGAVWQRGIDRLGMCQHCLFLGVMGYMHSAVCTYAYSLGLPSSIEPGRCICLRRYRQHDGLV